MNPGDKVWWSTTAGYWRWNIKVAATVVRTTAKRVIIDVPTKSGQVERKSVRLEKVTAKETA